MIRLNMLPEVKREYLRTKRLESTVIAMSIISVIVAVGLVVLLALWVYGAQTLQISGGKKSIDKHMSELKAVPYIDNYLSLQSQLANISTLHSQKNMYSRLFDILPKLNPAAPNNVLINQFEIDSTTKLVTFKGSTTTFTGLETFRDTLKNAKLVYSTKDSAGNQTENLFSDVVIGTQGIGPGDNGKQIVSFSITATASPNAFAYTTKTFDISVPNKETTQSKEDAPIFGSSTSTGGGQ